MGKLGCVYLCVCVSVAVSTTVHLTKYTQMKYTPIKWNTYVNHMAEVTDANLLATLAKLNLPK